LLYSDEQEKKWIKSCGRMPTHSDGVEQVRHTKMAEVKQNNLPQPQKCQSLGDNQSIQLHASKNADWAAL
jgi:hypothetical protein